MAVRLRRLDDDLEENHEINVTPFIDVMLVLLIIFMVAAPNSGNGRCRRRSPGFHGAAAPAAGPAKPIFLTIKADRSFSLGDEPVNKNDLGALLDRAAGGDKDRRVFVRADKSVNYDTLMQAMNDLREAGYLKIALVGLDKNQ